MTADTNRRLAERLGYKFVKQTLSNTPKDHWIYEGVIYSDLPDFIMSAKSSEEALETACSEHGLSWELHRTIVGKFICIITEVQPEGSEEEISNKLGETPSEARAEALLAALVAMEGK